MANKTLPLIADTDIASTVGVGASRSFAWGGEVGKKISKKEAKYTAGPSKQPCKTCTMFRAGKCTAVTGTISPMGHCKLYNKIKSYAKGGEVQGFEEGDEVPGAEEAQPEFAGNEDSDLAAPKELAPEQPEEEFTELTPEEVKRVRRTKEEQPEEDLQFTELTPEEAKRVRPVASGSLGEKVGTFAENAIESAAPLAASLYPMVKGGELGAMGGAALGARLGIPGGIPGVIGGALGGLALGGLAAYGAGEIQDYIGEKLGFIDKAARQARREENPGAAMAGQLAPAFATFGVGPIAGSLASRALVGGTMGAVEAAREKVAGEDFNPTEIATNVAQGAIFNKMRKWAEPLAGIRPPTKPGQPDLPITPEVERQASPDELGWPGGQGEPLKPSTDLSEASGEGFNMDIQPMDINQGVSTPGRPDKQPKASAELIAANRQLLEGIEASFNDPNQHQDPDRMAHFKTQAEGLRKWLADNDPDVAKQETDRATKKPENPRGQAAAYPKPEGADSEVSVTPREQPEGYSSVGDRNFPGNEDGRGHVKEPVDRVPPTVEQLNPDGVSAEVRLAAEQKLGSEPPIRQPKAEIIPPRKRQNRVKEAPIIDEDQKDHAARMYADEDAFLREKIKKEFPDRDVDEVLAEMERQDEKDLGEDYNPPEHPVVADFNAAKKQREAKIKADHEKTGDKWNGEYWESPEEQLANANEEPRNPLYSTQEELHGDTRSIGEEKAPKNVKRVDFSKKSKDQTNEPRQADTKEPVQPQRGPKYDEAVKLAQQLKEITGNDGFLKVLQHPEANEEHAQRFLEKLPEYLNELKAKQTQEKRKSTRAVDIHGQQVSNPGKLASRNAALTAQNEGMATFHKEYPEGYIPKTREEQTKYLDTLRRVMDKINETPEAMTFKNAQTSPAQDWRKSAKKLLGLKRAVPKSFETFARDNDLARTKEGAEIVRQNAKVEGEISRSQRRISGHEEQIAGETREEELARLQGEQEKEGDHLVDPNDPDLIKYIDAKQVENFQQYEQLAQNLNRAEHEAMREATEEPTKGINREGQKPGMKAEGLAERLASIDHDKMRRLAAARKARDESKIPPENKLGNLWADENGSLDIDKVKENFVKMKDNLFKWYDRNIGGFVTPARSGKLGSNQRKMGHYAESMFAHRIAWGHQQSMLYTHALDAAHKYFSKVDEGWKKGTVSKQDYIDGRNWNWFDTFQKVKTGPYANDFEKTFGEHARQVMDEIYAIEKELGSKAEYKENYLSGLFKNKGDYEKFDRYMQNKYGPTWFQKESYFKTLREAKNARLDLITTNPAEIISRRLMASVSMRMKMLTLNDLNHMGLAHPIKDAPAYIKNEPEGWLEIGAPDRQNWLVAPEASQMWKNAMDRDALWQGDNLLGSAYRTWMLAKAIWLPAKLTLSGFHMLHVAKIHLDAGVAAGWTYNGEKNKYGMPTNTTEGLKALKGALKGGVRNLGQVFTYPVGAANRAFIEPLLKQANDWGKIHGTNVFEPLFKASENFSKQFDGIKVLDAFNKPEALRTPQEQLIVDTILEGGGSPHPGADYDVKSAQGFRQAIGQGEYISEATIKRVPELLQKANPLQNFLFKHLIPMWKYAQYMNAAAELSRQHPEINNNKDLRKVMLSRLRKNQDERYGEMFYPAQVWGKMFKNVGQASFLSMGWNVGFTNTLAGAITDTVRSAGTMLKMLPERNITEQAIHDASDKMAYVATYTATAALITGVMSYLMSGEKPEGLDYVYPRSGGENPDGSPRRYTTMHFTREPVMLKKHAEAEGGLISGAADMLWSKMIFAPFVQAARNRDFYNREMSDPDASFFTKLGQRAVSLGKDLFTPISFESAKQSARTGGTARDQVMNAFGFGPAPAYISKKAIQNRIAHDYYEGPGAAVKPYKDRETAEQRLDLRAARQRAQRAGDAAGEEKAIQGLVDTGLKRKSVEKEQYGKQDVYQFSRLEPSKKVARVPDMDEDDFKKYVLDSMSKNDKRRVENGNEPLDRTHARMLMKWKELGHKVPELEF